MMSDLPEYVLDRTFDAPRELVWRAWTDPDILHRWYGPGVETIIHEFDLQPGGSWLNEMKWGDNSMFSKVVFQEVTPTSLLVWHHHSATNSDWSDMPNQMMPDWPRLLLTTVTFEEQGDQTNVRLLQVPMEATESELACFSEAMRKMDSGWGGGYKIIDELLAELKTNHESV